MLLLIYLEILLLVAVILLFVLKRRNKNLLKENVKLHEKIYQLRNKGDENALPGGHSHWEIVEPSELVYNVKEKDLTRMN